MAHIHAEKMKEYAEDATTLDKPWELWEYSQVKDNWNPCITHPLWSIFHFYRRKPQTILINGYSVPEPERVPPSKGCIYYLPNLKAKPEGLYEYYSWENDSADLRLLSKGLVHLNEQAAIDHALALLSFTKNTEDN